MWKIYYIKKIIDKIIENSITLSICSKIKNKEDIINILSNIKAIKQFILNPDIKKINNELYCNEMIFSCVFISNDKDNNCNEYGSSSIFSGVSKKENKYYEIYIFSNSEKKISIKELTHYDNYDKFTENISESYKFGYDIWVKDNNIDFSYYIDKLDWCASLDLFYDLNSYKMISNCDKLYMDIKLKTIELDKILDNKFSLDTNIKTCFFNKKKSHCCYYFHYTFLVKLLNNNIIAIDIIDEDDMYDGYSITLKVIEYNNINAYFQTKTVDIYYKTFGYDIKNIINYEYYIL